MPPRRGCYFVAFLALAFLASSAGAQHPSGDLRSQLVGASASDQVPPAQPPDPFADLAARVSTLEEELAQGHDAKPPARRSRP